MPGLQAWLSRWIKASGAIQCMSIAAQGHLKVRRDDQTFAAVGVDMHAEGSAAVHFLDAIRFAAGVARGAGEVDDAFLARLFLRVQHPQDPGFELVAQRAADDDANVAVAQFDDFPWGVDANHADKTTDYGLIKMTLGGVKQDAQRLEAGLTFALHAVTVDGVIAIGHGNDFREVGDFAGDQTARVAFAIQALVV